MEIDYIYFDEIDSTNNELRRRVEEGSADVLKEGTVVSAGRQTAGRGRSGHNWESPKDVSVSTSMILYPEEVPLPYIGRLTPMAAVAVSEAIEELYGLETGIKWPNDVLIGRKKVCGILTEMEPADDRVRYVIVGIGVNVHQREFPPEIAHMATSLDLALESVEGKSTVPKDGGRKQGLQETHCRELTERIWERFGAHYEAFLKTKDLSEVLDDYNRRLINRNEVVKVLDPQNPYEGVAECVDVAGRLLVRVGDEIRRVDSGEVSVRGIYGYV